MKQAFTLSCEVFCSLSARASHGLVLHTDNKCGGLKKLSPKESGTFGRYGFVGVGIVLLKEVCPCEGGL